MHDLEKLIADWRKEMTKEWNVGRDTLEELESHLREDIADLVRTGLPQAEAFQRAAMQLGASSAIIREFQKLNDATWLPVKVLAGIAVCVALLLLILFARVSNLRDSLLLVTHVYAVTLGYLTVFLTGTLGICFVCRRCVSDFSPSRAESIRQSAAVFACVAAILTMVGIVLGAIWAKINWGRYWAWDAKETSALCVVVWMLAIVCAGRLRSISDRAILVMSVLGNILVSVAWLETLLTRLSSYGAQYESGFLLLLVISNLAVFTVGLGPAGWLRLRKA